MEERHGQTEMDGLEEGVGWTYGLINETHGEMQRRLPGFTRPGAEGNVPLRAVCESVWRTKCCQDIRGTIH